MYNPFDVIIERLNELDARLVEISQVTPSVPQREIIDRKELCKRLAITEPTIIRWEKRGKIPCLHVGSSVRYNWPAVIDALENKKRR